MSFYTSEIEYAWISSPSIKSLDKLSARTARNNDRLPNSYKKLSIYVRIGFSFCVTY